ncbi:hypothetical protein KC640_03735, partial [Candidatus Dojkabacteria bacterium]|nr:hypothetical protein [Candidatus Dojkabacteria bacterium]
MNKDDRNTALIIIFVLVVCTISLIAIAGSLWSIVAPGVNGVLAFVGFNVRLANANYNFQVPAIADITPPSPSSTVPGSSPEGGLDNVIRSFDYNFTIPSAGDSTQGGQRDAILYDA